jgi:GrpB-like predicted nucleotidyltransferase (UPF0157 family)
VPKDYKGRKYSIEVYNQAWKENFEIEVAALRPVFGSKAVSIEHVGSTAVPGLAGKPTIDILVTVPAVEHVDQLVVEIAQLGYQALGDYLNKGSRLFVKEVNQERLVNLHIFAANHPHSIEMIELRDYFRTHPAVVVEYSNLKFALQRQYADDYGSYRTHKDAWMDNLKSRLKEITPEG